MVATKLSACDGDDDDDEEEEWDGADTRRHLRNHTQYGHLVYQAAVNEQTKVRCKVKCDARRQREDMEEEVGKELLLPSTLCGLWTV